MYNLNLPLVLTYKKNYTPSWENQLMFYCKNKHLPLNLTYSNSKDDFHYEFLPNFPWHPNNIKVNKKNINTPFPSCCFFKGQNVLTPNIWVVYSTITEIYYSYTRSVNDVLFRNLYLYLITEYLSWATKMIHCMNCSFVQKLSITAFILLYFIEMNEVSFYLYYCTISTSNDQ